VLDDDHRVPRVREQVQHGEQFRDVVEVEPGRRLVEHWQRRAKKEISFLANAPQGE